MMLIQQLIAEFLFVKLERRELIAEFLFVKLERRELTIFAFRFVNRLFTNFKQNVS